MGRGYGKKCIDAANICTIVNINYEDRKRHPSQNIYVNQKRPNPASSNALPIHKYITQKGDVQRRTVA